MRRHDGSVTSADVDAAPAPPRRRRKIDKQLVAVSLVVAVGLALVVRGLAVGVSGDDRANFPDQVEEVDPVPDAVQVLSQTRVFVDLEFGFTGVLVIDGQEIPTVDIGDVAASANAEPGEQVDVPPDTIYEAGNATLTYTPSDEGVITEFTPGQHRAQVIFWKVSEGRQRPRSYSWTFTVV